MTIGAADPIFLDTNVLVYANAATAPLHAIALTSLHEYAAAGHPLWISRQVLREYLATVTRPQLFLTPLPIENALARVRYFQAQFRIAEDGVNVTNHLLALIEQIVVGGKQVHDANIVATMQAYGIAHLLTHNTADFARFATFITVLPLKEAGGS